MKKVTNYEAIKNMTVEEMGAMFFIFMKPFLEVFNLDAEQRKQVQEQIRTFLNTERTVGK